MLQRFYSNFKKASGTTNLIGFPNLLLLILQTTCKTPRYILLPLPAERTCSSTPKRLNLAQQVSRSITNDVKLYKMFQDFKNPQKYFIVQPMVYYNQRCGNLHLYIPTPSLYFCAHRMITQFTSNKSNHYYKTRRLRSNSKIATVLLERLCILVMPFACNVKN